MMALHEEKPVNSRVLQELLYAGLLTPGETLSVVATDKPGTLGRGRVGADGTLLDEEGRSWSSLKSFVKHYKWGGRKRVIQPLENIRIESSGKRLGLIYRELILGKPEKARDYADEVDEEIGEDEPGVPEAGAPEEEEEVEEPPEEGKRPHIDASSYRVTLRHLVSTGLVKPGTELEYFRSNHKKAVVLDNGGVKSGEDGTEHASLASWVRSMYPNGSAALSRFKLVGTARYLSDVKDIYLQRVGTENLPRRKRSKTDDQFASPGAPAYRQSYTMSPDEEIRLHNEAAEMKERIEKLEVSLDDMVIMLKHYLVTIGQPSPPELETLFQFLGN